VRVLGRVSLPVLLCAGFLLAAFPLQAVAQDQPLITQIDVVGAHKVDEATVRFKLKSRVGDRYSPDTVREDLKALYSLGFFEDIVVRADIFEGGLRLTFVLYEKPSIESIKFIGNKKLSTDKIKAKVDLVEGGVIPPGALAKNVEKIRLYYEEEGYYRARIEASEERVSPQEVAVTFTIAEGDKFDVSDIDVVGNVALTAKQITHVMQTEPLYLFFFGGTLKREELRRDTDRIRLLYLDNGFLDIAVQEPEIEIDDARKKLRIVIKLQEGPQYHIARLTITGNKLFPEADLMRILQSRAGGVFSREKLQADVVAITDQYTERGYLFAEVNPLTDVHRETSTVDVSVEIAEGAQVYVNRVEIRGNVRTRDKVIRREMRLVEGNVFSSSLVQVSKKNLEALGYFEEVKFEPRRTPAPDQVDIAVDLKEKPTGAFSIGGGFSSVDGLLAAASISQSNLFGYGKAVSLTGQYGQNASRLNFVYTDPHVADSNYLGQARFFANSTDYVSAQGFKQENYGGSALMGHPLGFDFIGSISYLWEWIKIYDLTLAAPPLVVEQAAENGGVSKTSAIILTLRRDTLDNVFTPTRGLRIESTFEYAGGPLAFGSDYNNFWLTTLEASYYRPLWWVLVGHVRGFFGYGEAFSTTPDLPVQQRFYLGGINTIRGYKNFTVGPLDPVTLTNEGGNKAFYIQNEILFPLYEPLRLRGLVFFDMGNAFGESQSLSWNVQYGTGVGIHFNSPLGNIQLAWGFPLNPRGVDRKQVLYFSAGRLF
jgi:outer membrane protein insertion porin family